MKKDFLRPLQYLERSWASSIWNLSTPEIMHEFMKHMS